MTIKVSIVEDNRSARKSLETLVSRTPGLECMGAYGSGETAVFSIPAEGPDVALVGMQLPRMSSIECVARLKASMPALQVLMLANDEESELILDSFRAGANGCLTRNLLESELVKAVEQVHAGDAPLSMPIARKMICHFHRNQQPMSSIKKLTRREREILRLLARGDRYKEIGEKLGISLHTVRAHLHTVYAKLGVRSRTGAVIKFLKRN